MATTMRIGKALIVVQLVMVMLAAIVLNPQAVAASAGVLLPGLPTATPRNTVLCFDSTEQLGPCAPGIVVTPPCVEPNQRFKDCGNGTVYDKQTGLMWEKKLASSDAACTAPAQANRNARCQQNTYTWSASGTAVDETLYTNFLVKLNSHADGTTVADGNESLQLQTCFAGHCDWRIPDVYELQSILLAPFPCGVSPCIDAVFGPTQTSFYGSPSSLASSELNAWFVFFDLGDVGFGTKNNGLHARAVRGGR